MIRLARALAERNVRVWLDVFELRPGEAENDRIRDALRSAAVVLVCVGAHTPSRAQLHEVSLAELHPHVRVVTLPGWTPDRGHLGLDDRAVDELHGGDEAWWTCGLEILVAALVADVALQPQEGETTSGPFAGSPYPGLERRFGPEHAAWFFGREHETADLVRALRKHRWVWLVGNSGSGKSSLARAGVMSWWPRASAERGYATVFEPSAKATEDLAGALDRVCRWGGKEPVDLQKLAASPEGWSAELRARWSDTEAAPPVLVVVDQAEQMFAYQSTGASSGLRGTCAEMVSALWSLVTDGELPVRVHVLVVLRSDWLRRALDEEALEPMFRVSRTQVNLPGMDDAPLRDTIVQPARRAGGDVCPHAVDALVKAVRGREHGLPLLQLVLRDAWQRVSLADRRLRLETIGTQPLEDAVRRLVADQERAAAFSVTDAQLDALVPYLVELDDLDAPRRRRLPRHALAEHPNAATLHRAIDVLVRARVVIAVGDPDGSDDTADDTGWQLAHDTVLTAWGALASAIARRTDCLKQIASLDRLAREGSLLQGASLARYEFLLDEPTLGERAAEFLQASISARTEAATAAAAAVAVAASTAAREQSHRRRRLAMTTAGLGVLALVLSALVVYSRAQERRAEREADEAEAQRRISDRLAAHAKKLAGEAAEERDLADELLAANYLEEGRRKLLDEQAPGEALALLREARRFGAAGRVIDLLAAQAQRSLPHLRIATGCASSGIVGSLRGPEHRSTGLTRSPAQDGASPGVDGDAGCDSRSHAMRALAFSPDGTRIVTANDAGARIWNTRDGVATTPFLDHVGLTGLQTSPDGSLLLTVGRSAVRMWDAHRGVRLLELTDERAILAATFGGGGTWVLVATDDGCVRVYRSESGERIDGRCTAAGQSRRALFSEDSQHVVFVDRVGRGHVADSATGAPVLAWRNANHWSGAFGGGRFVTTSPAGPASVWELSAGHARVLTTGDDAVGFAGLSSDGARLVTADLQRTARLWDVVTGKPLSPPLLHEHALRGADFSPDGTVLATCAGNRVFVRDAATGRETRPPLVHDGDVVAIAFSPDSRSLATASGSGLVSVWSLAPTLSAATLVTDGGEVTAVRFSLDGRSVLVAAGRQVSVFDAATGGRTAGPYLHDHPVVGATFDPSGARVLTASGVQAQIWPEGTRVSHRSTLRAATWSADGERIVTAGDDGIAQVWKATAGAPLGPPLVHGGAVHDAVFSPDGRRVVTGSADVLARVWKAGASHPIRHWHGGEVLKVEPDRYGEKVLSTSDDGTVHVWSENGDAYLLPHGGRVTAATFAPDGARVLTACEDGLARVWNAGVVELTLRHDRPLRSAAFSPDGALLLTAGDDGKLHFWDATTGRAVTPPLAHGSAIVSAAFSPDGERVVTGGVDGTARLWDFSGKPSGDSAASR